MSNRPVIFFSYHESDMVKVHPNSYLGGGHVAFRDAVNKADAIFRREKKEVFWLIDPKKAEGLKDLLLPNFDVAVAGDAEALIESAKQEEKKVEDTLYLQIQKTNTAWEKINRQLVPMQLVDVMKIGRTDRVLDAKPPGGMKSSCNILSVLPGRDVYIVCTKSVKHHWKDEILMTRPWEEGLEERIVVHKKPIKEMPPPTKQAMWHILNYEQMPDASVLKNWLPKPGSYFILDEAHNCSEPKTKRYKKAEAFASAILGREGHGSLLTGSPIDGKPYRLWCMLKLVGLENTIFKSFKNFMHLYNARVGDWGLVWGKPRPEVKPLLQKHCIIRSEAEIQGELPDRRVSYIPFDVPSHMLTADMNKLLNKLKKEEERGLSWEEIVKRCKQRRLGIPFEELQSVKVELARAAIPLMKEIVKEYLEAGIALIVASDHIEPLKELEMMPEAANGDVPIPIIIGETSENQRERIIRDWQDGIIPVLGISIKAVKEGVNLTRGHHMLIVDQSWSWEANRQLRARIYRPGQHNGVIYKIPVARHPLALRILEVTLNKKVISEETLGYADKKKVKDWEGIAKKAIAKMKAEEKLSRTEQMVLSYLLKRRKKDALL